MPKTSDYFINHRVAEKWPFTIYHTPIENRIWQAVQKNSSRSKALNLGCGLFHSYPRYAPFGVWSACDIDERAVAAVKNLYPEINTFVCDPMPELGESVYDLIVAKEVIEHVLDPKQWLERLWRALRPGGSLLLSTPNYGLSLLPVLEYTVLEVLARRRGFSRFDIHPTKFSMRRLQTLLPSACAGAKSIQVDRESWGMVLFAQITK